MFYNKSGTNITALSMFTAHKEKTIRDVEQLNVILFVVTHTGCLKIEIFHVWRLP